MQREGDIFGPECKVTISQEGRNLNKQQETGEEKSARSTRAERKLFRQQEKNGSPSGIQGLLAEVTDEEIAAMSKRS